MLLRPLTGMTLVALMALAPGTAAGQAYPYKPIRIVASGAGGGNDLVARMIAQAMTGSLGQQVVVENRGGGVTAAEIVVHAQPNGYTLLLYGSTIWLSPLMREHTPYDPIKDFYAVTWATSAPNLLVVHPSVAASSVRELIALAKARPGALNYASGATGASNHLAAELFKAMAGVNIVRIPYKGNGPAINDLIAGQVQLTFATAGGIEGHVKSGRLRALAVTSATPSALAPGLPTVAASGLQGYESVAMAGVFAPAKTPAPILARLHEQVVRVLKTPEVKDKLFSTGVETVGSSPQEFAAKIKSDMLRMGKVIKDAGIREE